MRRTILGFGRHSNRLWHVYVSSCYFRTKAYLRYEKFSQLVVFAGRLQIYLGVCNLLPYSRIYILLFGNPIRLYTCILLHRVSPLSESAAAGGYVYKRSAFNDVNAVLSDTQLHI